MKTKLLVLAAALLLVPMSAMSAESPLHGIWRVNADSLQATRAHEFAIRDGMYACMSCSPSYSIPADGAFHAVPSSPSHDELAVLVLDPRKLQITERKNGQLVANSIYEVANHGTLTLVEYQDHTGSQPVVSHFSYARQGNGPGDAHAASGNWSVDSFDELSNSGRLLTLAVSGDRLRMDNPQGHSFTAVMDGTQATYTGSPIVSSVSVRKISPHRIQVTRYNDGQVVSISTYHVLPNGQTMKVVHEDPRDGSKLSYVATRLGSPDDRRNYGVGDVALNVKVDEGSR